MIFEYKKDREYINFIKGYSTVIAKGIIREFENFAIKNIKELEMKELKENEFFKLDKIIDDIMIKFNQHISKKEYKESPEYHKYFRDCLEALSEKLNDIYLNTNIMQIDSHRLLYIINELKKIKDNMVIAPPSARTHRAETSPSDSSVMPPATATLLQEHFRGNALPERKKQLPREEFPSSQKSVSPPSRASSVSSRHSVQSSPKSPSIAVNMDIPFGNPPSPVRTPRAPSVSPSHSVEELHRSRSASPSLTRAPSVYSDKGMDVYLHDAVSNMLVAIKNNDRDMRRAIQNDLESHWDNEFANVVVREAMSYMHKHPKNAKIELLDVNAVIAMIEEKMLTESSKSSPRKSSR